MCYGRGCPVIILYPLLNLILPRVPSVIEVPTYDGIVVQGLRVMIFCFTIYDRFDVVMRVFSPRFLQVLGCSGP